MCENSCLGAFVPEDRYLQRVVWLGARQVEGALYSRGELDTTVQSLVLDREDWRVRLPSTWNASCVAKIAVGLGSHVREWRVCNTRHGHMDAYETL